MRCEKIRPWVSQSIDGTLPPGPTELVEQHLRECPDCAVFQQELKRTVGLLARLERTSVSDGFTARVMAQVRAQQAAQPRRWSLREIWPRLFAPPQPSTVWATVTLLVVVIGSFCLMDPARVWIRIEPEGRPTTEAQQFVEACVREYEELAQAGAQPVPDSPSAGLGSSLEEWGLN